MALDPIGRRSAGPPRRRRRRRTTPGILGAARVRGVSLDPRRGGASNPGARHPTTPAEGGAESLGMADVGWLGEASLVGWRPLLSG